MKRRFALFVACAIAGCGVTPSGPALTASQCREVTDKNLNVLLANGLGGEADEGSRRTWAAAYDECVAGKTWINNKKFYDCIHGAGDNTAVMKCTIENGGGKML